MLHAACRHASSWFKLANQNQAKFLSTLNTDQDKIKAPAISVSEVSRPLGCILALVQMFQYTRYQ